MARCRSSRSRRFTKFWRGLINVRRGFKFDGGEKCGAVLDQKVHAQSLTLNYGDLACIYWDADELLIFHSLGKNIVYKF